MFSKLLLGAKFVALFAVFWFLATGALIAVMIAVSQNGELHPAWVLPLLVVPAVAAIFLTRFTLRKSLAESRASKEAAREASAVKELAAKRAAKWHERQLILAGIEEHRPALARNYRTAVKRNDYGVILSDNRPAILLEFLYSIGFTGEHLSEGEAIELVESALENALAPQSTFGWTCRTTPAGGDQGIDIIAQKDGFRLGIQCKLYSQAVGNRAVQEALAGIQYYGLHLAAVLTNAPFTKSASDLAAAANVLLVSHYDIPNLADVASRQLRTAQSFPPMTPS